MLRTGAGSRKAGRSRTCTGGEGCVVASPLVETNVVDPRAPVIAVAGAAATAVMAINADLVQPDIATHRAR